MSVILNYGSVTGINAQDVAIKSGTYANMLDYSASAGDLWYSTDYNIFFLYSKNRWRAVPIDARTARWWLEDFDHANTTGNMAWSLSAGSGSSMSVADAEINRPGVVRMNAATATNQMTIYKGALSVLPGQGIIEIEIGMRFENFGDGTDNYTLHFGLGDVVSTTDLTDGVVFLYDFATYGNVFRGKTYKAGSATTGSTDSATLATGTWYSLLIRITGSTKAEFFLNGTLFDTITTNIPSTAFSHSTGPLMKMIKTLGTGARNVRVDFYDYVEIFTTTRGIA